MAWSEQQIINKSTGLIRLNLDISSEIIPKTMVEIGCYVGISTSIFAQFFETVYGVDPWISGYDDGSVMSTKLDLSKAEETFDKHTAPFKNIIKIKKKSVDASKDFKDNSLDFVYIDGSHTKKCFLEDLYHWYPKVGICGFIGGHDYNMNMDRLKHIPKLVQHIFGQDPTLKIYAETSWCLRIIDDEHNNKYMNKIAEVWNGINS